MEWIFMFKEVILACLLWLLTWACFDELLHGKVAKSEVNFNIFMGFVVATIAGLMTWESVVKVTEIVQSLG